MTSHFEEDAPLIVRCDCDAEECATWLELTPDDILVIEDADGSRLSLVLPDWLANALRTAAANQAADTHVSQSLASMPPTAWPAPTVAEPDLETLEEWMNEESGCAATGGCWTEPDGICVHGHPSWLLALGYI